MRSRVEGMGRRAKYANSLGRRRSAYASGVSSRRLVAAMAARNVVVRRAGFGRAGPGRMEFKSIDVAQGPTAVDQASSVLLLNGCARGDDIGARTGRQIMMASIEAKFYNYSTVTTGINQVHRVLLVLDRQPNGAALTAAQVLTTVNTLSSRLLENRNRFRILMDRRMTLDAATISGSRRVTKFYKRLHVPVTFNSGNAGTLADIATNSLYVIAIGSEAAGATAGSIQGFYRVRFTDQ